MCGALDVAPSFIPSTMRREKGSLSRQCCLPLTAPRPSSILLSKASLTIWGARERAPPCPSGPGEPLDGRDVAYVYPMSVWRNWPMCQGEWDPGTGEVLSVFMSGWRQCWLPLSCVCDPALEGSSPVSQIRGSHNQSYREGGEGSRVALGV